MRLGKLIDSDDSREVTGFAIDHRKVAPGTIFGAFRGSRFNGEDFVDAAVAAGAIAIVSAPGLTVAGATHIIDANPRLRFAHLAARYFQPFPETIVAVTGTNGKTSNVELTRQLWRMAGHSAASIGTLGVTTPNEQVVTGLTTPDIVTFLSNVAGLKWRASAISPMKRQAMDWTSIVLKGRALQPVPLPTCRVIISIIMAIWTHIWPPRCGCFRRLLQPMVPP